MFALPSHRGMPTRMAMSQIQITRRTRAKAGVRPHHAMLNPSSQALTMARDRRDMPRTARTARTARTVKRMPPLIGTQVRLRSASRGQGVEGVDGVERSSGSSGSSCMPWVRRQEALSGFGAMSAAASSYVKKAPKQARVAEVMCIQVSA